MKELNLDRRSLNVICNNIFYLLSNVCNVDYTHNDEHCMSESQLYSESVTECIKIKLQRKDYMLHIS